MLRRSCDRGDDRGPRDADQPRAGREEKEPPDGPRREPPHRPEDDEVRPQRLLRANHPGRRGGEAEGENVESRVRSVRGAEK